MLWKIKVHSIKNRYEKTKYLEYDFIKLKEEKKWKRLIEISKLGSMTLK